MNIASGVSPDFTFYAKFVTRSLWRRTAHACVPKKGRTRRRRRRRRRSLALAERVYANPRLTGISSRMFLRGKAVRYP